MNTLVCIGLITRNTRPAKALMYSMNHSLPLTLSWRVTYYCVSLNYYRYHYACSIEEMFSSNSKANDLELLENVSSTSKLQVNLEKMFRVIINSQWPTDK